MLAKQENMAELNAALAEVLANCYASNLARISELASPLTDSQFWTKPFPFGNSFGHLVLHLTGNLNYYIGAQVAQTGYVRDRPREFTESNPPSKQETLKRFGDTVAMVIETIHSQSSDDWVKPYSAVGIISGNQLNAVVICAAHMQHHIGQMIYLTNELQRKAS